MVSTVDGGDGADSISLRNMVASHSIFGGAGADQFASVLATTSLVWHSLPSEQSTVATVPHHRLPLVQVAASR